MRPAGMSSDEEEDDDYFYMGIIRKKSDSIEKQPQLMEYLPPEQSGGLRTLLDNSTKSSSFHKAAEEADFLRMEELIRNGVSVDDSKINEWTPLMKACSEGKHDVVRFLLEKGANPNLHKELFTPLMACCTLTYVPEEDRLECARLLIQFGANVNATDKHKSTALMLAAGNGWTGLIEELLNSPDIDINMQDKEGWTALFHAVHYNNKSVVDKLISAGINLHTLNRHREYDAIQLAEMKNYKDIIKSLKQVQGEPVTDEVTIPPVKHVNDNIRKDLDDFRYQFPDERGRGGFSKDVRDIFAGAGLGKLYDKLNINVDFPDFLTGTNLAELGVKYEPMRHKMQKGIHRYHLVPWARNSLHLIHTIEVLNMENCIQAISDVTKHLAIMYASLDYVRIRIRKWEGKTYDSFDRVIIDLLVESYVEIQKTKRLLENICRIVDKIKPTGDVEADFVGSKHKCQGKRSWKKTLLKVGIASSILYLCCKFR